MGKLRKYTKEQIDYVIDKITGPGNIKVVEATRMMCKEFNLEFNEALSKTFRNKMADLGYVTSNRYSKEQIDFIIRLINEKNVSIDEAAALMSERFGVKLRKSVINVVKEIIGGKVFSKVSKKQLKDSIEEVKNPKKKNKIEDDEMFINALNRNFNTTKKRFLITWAQSYSDVLLPLWDNMIAYADKINADIHVIAGRYKNPTNLEKNTKIIDSEKGFNVWPEILRPYLDANRQNIHKLLTICSDIKVQPTASTPLSGLNGITELESCIIGHPRVHMDSCPVLDGYPNKFLYTTGAITKPDYTDTKAGKKGEFHHQYGFVVVELDGDEVHVRQIQSDVNGTFYDLFYKVENGIVSNYVESGSDGKLTAVLGDLHIGDHDDKATNASFDLMKVLKVKDLVVHDIFNGHSISHHELNDPFIQLRRELNGSNSLKGEIKLVKNFLKQYPEFNFTVVRSNHDDFLDRWLKSNDWRHSPNRLEFIKYANLLSSGKAFKGIIPYVLEKKFKNLKALGINESFRVLGIECGMHGHLGSNGSRGSYTQFKNLNTKNITAHTHTPRRFDGHSSVGTLTHKRLEYTNGPSSWAQTNILIYPNGKHSHLTLSSKYRFTTFFD